MVIELAIAFVLILAVSLLIYMLGCLFAARPTCSESGKFVYACGEKVKFGKLKISISHYRYLIYFVILDSSVLFAAFASTALNIANVLFFILYLFIVFMSGLLLLDGGDR
ncbi:MAG: hypothetical protein QXZ02_06430 [Candidatus Bathyarchaeia archaeon]